MKTAQRDNVGLMHIKIAHPYLMTLPELKFVMAVTTGGHVKHENNTYFCISCMEI